MSDQKPEAEDMCVVEAAEILTKMMNDKSCSDVNLDLINISNIVEQASMWCETAPTGRNLNEDFGTSTNLDFQASQSARSLAMVSPSPMRIMEDHEDEYQNQRFSRETWPSQSNKRRISLAMPEDSESLNSLHCFVRSNLLEVFVTGPEKNNRVGLRCVFCSHINRRLRDSGSAQFPRTTADIYRSVCTWQRVHFQNCRYVPSSVLERYRELKECDRTRGKVRYWMESAKKLGLMDNITSKELTVVNDTYIDHEEGSNTPNSQENDDENGVNTSNGGRSCRDVGIRFVS